MSSIQLHVHPNYSMEQKETPTLINDLSNVPNTQKNDAMIIIIQSMIFVAILICLKLKKLNISWYTILISIYALNNKHCNAETIINPGGYQIISCGLNEDCTIICDETDGCTSAEFYVYNHNINIICAEWNSCFYLKISSWNTTSLNLTFTGNYTAQFAEVYTDPTDDTVTTKCYGEYSCEGILFHYSPNGGFIHECSNEAACKGTTLVTLSTGIIYCDYVWHSCSDMMLITSNNNVFLQVSGTFYAEKLYPIYILTYPGISFSESIICSNCSLDLIYIVAGIEFNFETACKASNTICLNQQNENKNMNDNTLIVNTMIDEYPLDYNFSQYKVTGDMLLILTNMSLHDVVTTPIMDNSSLLSIICTYCDEVIFELALTCNVVMTIPSTESSLRYSDVYGPQYWFKSQGFSFWNHHNNIYYLQNTSNIELINLYTNNVIYLGDTTNLLIDCDSLPQTCSDVNVYSSLDPSETGLVDLGWDIRCDASLNWTCVDFYFNFPKIGETCSYSGVDGLDIDTECDLIQSNSIINQKTFDYYLPTLIVFMVLICLMSFCSFLDNQRPNGKIDDARYLAIVTFGLQCIDLVTDIILCIEMIKKFNQIGGLLLGIISYGSLTFIIVPYIFNISMAANIKRMAVIRNNFAAKTYFEQYVFLFISLVVLCGGTYPVLSLLSSRIFAQSIFDSGLTTHHLRELGAIKVAGTVLLENLPQLICQIIYLVILDGIPSNNVLLAFLASIFSIIAASVSYFVHRRRSEEDGYVIEYDLEMIITHKNDLNNINESDCGNLILLTDNEKKRIENKKERKKALRRELAPSLDIGEHRLEFGYVTLTKAGCVIHCIHFTFKKEIENILEKTNTMLDIMNSENSLHLSSLLFVRKLYESHNENVIGAFCKHFSFYEDETDIVFHEKYHVNIYKKKERMDYSSLKTVSDSQLNAGFKLIQEINSKLLDGLNGNTIYDELIEQQLVDKQLVDASFAFIKAQNKRIGLEVASIKVAGATFYEMTPIKKEFDEAKKQKKLVYLTVGSEIEEDEVEDDEGEKQEIVDDKVIADMLSKVVSIPPTSH